MTTQTPTPLSLLLRLKHHKTTILLHVAPTEPFRSIKTLLLQSLSAAKIASINGHPVPTSIESIEFGVPRNNNDLTEGFVPLEMREGIAARKMKGKENEREGKGRQPKSVFNDTPAGAGLKDGQAVAFRFREKVAVENDEEKEKEEEKEEDEDKSEDEMDMEEEEEWDVVVPSFDLEEG